MLKAKISLSMAFAFRTLFKTFFRGLTDHGNALKYTQYLTTFRDVAPADFEVVRTERKVKANKAHQTKNCSKTRNDSLPFIRSY